MKEYTLKIYYTDSEIRLYYIDEKKTKCCMSISPNLEHEFNKILRNLYFNL